MTLEEIKGYFKELTAEGTKQSSVRFFMLGTLGASLILYTSVAFVLIYDVIKDGYVSTDLIGLGAFVASASINTGVGGLTKVLSNKNDTPKEENS